MHRLDIKRNPNELGSRSIVYPDLSDEMSVFGVPKVVSKVVDGIIVKDVEFVVENDIDRYKGEKCTDYEISNLLEAGVDPNSLNRVVFNPHGLDYVDEIVENVESLNLK